MKKITIYFIIILLAEGCFLFSPAPDLSKDKIKLCLHDYVQLNKYMGISINCDAPVFVGSAINLNYLFQQDFSRQSRPLYILIGGFCGRMIYYISYPLHNVVKTKFSSQLKSLAANGSSNSILYACTYLGFIGINFLIMILCFYLFKTIVVEMAGPWKNNKFLFYALLLLLASNHLTKVFFWTAHLQLFNILVPLTCVYLSLKIPGMGLKTLYWISALSGLLLLIYGSFLLLLPVLLYFFAHNTIRQRFSWAKLLPTVVIISIFFTPSFVWIWILQLNNISYYSDEITRYRQFVWIIDFLQISIGSFGAVLWNKTLDYISTFGSLVFIFCLFLCISLIRFFRSRNSNPINKCGQNIRLQNLAFVFFLILGFYWLLGYYADRLTFSLAPVLLCYAAVYINSIKLNRSQQLYLICFAIFVHTYTVFFEAPHFSNLFYK